MEEIKFLLNKAIDRYRLIDCGGKRGYAYNNKLMRLLIYLPLHITTAPLRGEYNNDLNLPYASADAHFRR